MESMGPIHGDFRGLVPSWHRLCGNGLAMAGISICIATWFYPQKAEYYIIFT